MAAGDTLPGRLLLDDRIPLEEPGDYRVIFERGEPKALAFILPDGTRGRIAATGHGDGSPEWEIKVVADGTVTVSPSIDAVGVWHGYLERGIWREC